ncbi:MAG: class I SAM-dependent methyltransferase [Deltaproteobacteria bacterium]|nr:class I SAM-dependent methyltransferase [Deltaproteobacteria bacterium]
MQKRIIQEKATTSASDKNPQHFPPTLASASELLASYWGRVPLSLALREVHRLLALGQLLDDQPDTQSILDVGVGDGFWWQTLKTTRPENVYGIDISDEELRLARTRLPQVANIDVSGENVGDDFAAQGWPRRFHGIIGNCSLEHVPNLEAALANIYEALEPGGWFVLFVPTPGWAMQGRMQKLLRKRAPRLAMMTSGAINGFFQHWHLMDRPTWTRLLESYGFDVVKVLEMGGQRSEFLYRLGLPPAFAAFLVKEMSGQYPHRLLPKRPIQALTKRVVRWLDDELSPREAGTRKTGTRDASVQTAGDDAYEFAIRCRKPK